MKSAQYWKSKYHGERAQLQLDRARHRETVTDLVRRLGKARRTMARVREYARNLPSCF